MIEKLLLEFPPLIGKLNAPITNILSAMNILNI